MASSKYKVGAEVYVPAAALNKLGFESSFVHEHGNGSCVVGTL